MTNRKILVFGRHGRAPQNAQGSVDALIPDSVTALYLNALPLYDEVSGAGITPNRSYLIHSPRVRTKYTGQAIVVAALGLVPRLGSNPPTCQEDLAHYNFSQVETTIDERLNFGDPFLNMVVYKAQGNVADDTVDHWLSHPDSCIFDGVPIEPYQSVKRRTSAALSDALYKLMSDEKDFGDVVSHSGLPEAIAIALVNSARQTPVQQCEEIGGGFAMEQHATLLIDKTVSGVFTATLERNGQRYNVDVEKLR